jgi:hypothetical protein
LWPYGRCYNLKKSLKSTAAHFVSYRAVILNVFMNLFSYYYR